MQLRKPFCLNNLVLQKVLWDRRLVLHVLDALNVPTPNRLVVERDGGVHISSDVRSELAVRGIRWSTSEVVADVAQLDADTIRVGSRILKKPFVEKPVDGEDHNVWIYFSSGQGGGVRKLFRKIANKSSEFFPDLIDIRRDGSYIYEEFMNVDNAEDVKIYTVGDDYFYAETRKYV